MVMMRMIASQYMPMAIPQSKGWAGDGDDGAAVHAGGVPAIKRVGAHCRDLQDRQLVNSVLLKYFCKYSSIQHYCFLYCSVAKCVPNVFLKHSNKKSSEHALCH